MAFIPAGGMMQTGGTPHAHKVRSGAMNARFAVLISLAAASSLLTVTSSRSDEPAKAEKSAADPMLGKKLGQVREDNGLKMKLVWCPPGLVTMEEVEIGEEPVTTEDEDEAASKTQQITPLKVLLTA